MSIIGVILRLYYPLSKKEFPQKKIKEKAADIKACRLIISIEPTTDSDEFCEISVLDIQSLGDVLVDDLAVVAVNTQSNSLVSLGSFFEA